MKEIGTAIAVDDRKVTVLVKRTAACDRCGRCTHPQFVLADNSNLTIEAISAGDIRLGDTVELEMDSRDFLKASFLVYLLPVVAAGSGYGLGWLLGSALGNSGMWGGVFSLGSFALSFAWLHQYDKSAQRSGRYLPLARPVRDLWG